MNEDEDFLAEAHQMEAEAERIRQEAEDVTSDPAAEQEWIRQSNLIYGGLAAAGLVVVQPFLTETSLDPSALVCVIAFAVSIPLLAALLVLNRQEEFRRRTSKSAWRFIDPSRCRLRRGRRPLLGLRAPGVRLEVPLKIPSPQATRSGLTGWFRPPWLD